ncbi:hypothetical protein [Bradyrhizobium sp. BWA-3-5]|uniref:hypothetical protein n=1 Tax=Bradyrhizobium sp. BWA-3-5 TaxID=3080013 RepID=UPI00293F1F71|nr:hypothetical protein [Bradyrhizobium sp. BWA-3-5]WOH63659.1 hypothetical protein RX331_23415 [Bradyrhizobium sp. BWA-3-5]
MAQLDRTSTTYHFAQAWRLRGVLNRTAWQRSLDRVWARHEALRSVFVASEGEPRVEVLPPDAGPPVVEHDLRDRVDADAALADLCQEEVRTTVRSGTRSADPGAADPDVGARARVPADAASYRLGRLVAGRVGA